MNMNKMSPLSIKSSDSLKYSESECPNNIDGYRSKKTSFAGENETVNTSPNFGTSPHRNNYDFGQENSVGLPLNLEETKVMSNDGSFRFVLTEVINGSTEKGF
jgi:hypothetical protein